MRKISQKKGVTLVETLVYTAIFTMFVLTLSSFSSSIQSARLRNQSMLEVHYQGNFLIQTITSSIRNAIVVHDPVISNSGTSLSLETSDPLTNPTVFTVATGTLYMKEGSSNPVALTNNRVEVYNVSFSNLSRPSTPDTVRIRFSVKNSNNQSRPEEEYTKDFYGSASIR